MTKLKIKVTKDILERSKMCGEGDDNGFKGYSCAIALAVRDIWPHANVGRFDIFPYYNTIGIRPNMELPLEAINFIAEFDHRKIQDRPLMPEIEFEIEVPDEVIEKINIEELKPLLENHPTLELIEN